MNFQSVARFRRGLCAVLVLSLPIGLSAQVTRGSVTGVIQDPTGAVIPGVAVSVVNQATGTKSEVQSGLAGVYFAPQLMPGTYTVSASAKGFKHLTIEGLKIDVGTTLTQDLKMEVGDVTQRVEVTGQTNLVETTSGRVGTTVQINQVLELPLTDRNVFTLINLVPGGFFKYIPGDNPMNAFLAGTSLGGGRTQSAVGLLDGINNTRGGFAMHTIEMAPPADAMQEFKVEVNNLSAEYGRSSGGVVNAVTKSGTNKFHGTAYEYLRNDKLDAAGWGNDRKPPLRRNNFGATVGGPIKKDRTFFFYNFDGLRQRLASVVTRDVGLPEWRRGDFSTLTRDAGGRAAFVPIHDSESGTGTFTSPRGTLQFPGNVIPSARLDPVAVKAVSYLPTPNRPPNNPFNQTGNWQLNRSNPVTRDFHIGRVDHEWSDSTKMFVRYILNAPERDFTQLLKDFGPTDLANSNDNRHQNIALNVTHLFSPSFFLTFSAGVNRVRARSFSGPPCCETNWGNELGLRGVPGLTFPVFDIRGGLVPVGQIGGGGLRMPTNTNPEVTGNFTRIRGNHTLKFGGQHSRFTGNIVIGGPTGGNWTFDGRFTRGVQDNGAAIANTGANLADFILGRLTGVDVNVTPTRGTRIHYYGAYIQDDWRVSRNLTLNLGLRYDTMTPFREVADRNSNFDPYAPNPRAGTGDIPVGAIGVVTFQNRHGYGKYLTRWYKVNLGPRFGFAYRLLGASNTTIRGGYGIFYGNLSSGEALGSTGFSQIYGARDPIPYRLRDGLPAGALDLIPESELTPTFGNRGTRFVQTTFNYRDPDFPITYAQNFNLTIQHQWRGILFETGYVGNLGRQVYSFLRNLNLIRPELLSRTDIGERLRRPWTIFGSDQATIAPTPWTGGISNYHAFNLRIERRFSNGIGWTFAYALSKWIDDEEAPAGPIGTDNPRAQNVYNRRAERRLSTSHIPHRVVFSPIVELPFGKGKRWLNHGGAANAVLGGLQVSAVGTLQKGSPFGSSVLNGALNLLGDGAVGAILRPHLVQDQNLNSPNQGQPAVGVRGIQWLNPSGFLNPPRFTYGNAAASLPGVLGPGLVNFDTLVAKNFYFAERWRVQFRWEMFNLTNTPVWAQPASAFGAGNFGISASASSRRVMQFGLKLYW